MSPIPGAPGVAPGENAAGGPVVASRDNAAGVARVAARDNPAGDRTARLIAGRYRLDGQIGRGAMGIVWRATDQLLARDVAVKEIQITVHAYADVIYQRTLREARTAARLSHPGVVTVFDVVEEDGSLWIVMELVKARSLDRVIIEDGPLPPLQAAELGTCLVGALSTAHSAGVLHRDVKPSNVLVTGEGKAVLTDFGIATFAEDPSVTQAGMVVGTPGFTAPERVRGDAATPASDLWSVGATLYAAVEGRGPFDRVGGSTVISAGVASEDAPRAPSAGPLAPVIEALLNRDPGARPDATSATRLLSDAATAARTGAAPLGDGWPVADAPTDPARVVSTGERAAQSGPQHPGPDRPGPDPGGAATDDGAPRGVPADDRRPAHHGTSEQRPAFLDPPAYAELVMPAIAGLDDAPVTPAGAAAEAGPVSGLAPGSVPPGWLDEEGPVTPGTAGPTGRLGRTGTGGPGSGQAAGTGPAGWPGSADPGPPPPPAPPEKPGTSSGGDGSGGRWAAARDAMLSSGRWRLMVAAAGIAAIAVAAVIGWGIYNSTPSARSIQGSIPPGSGVAAISGPTRHNGGHGGKTGGGKHSGGSAPSSGGAPTGSKGHSHGTGKPGPSGKPSSHPSTTTSGSSEPSKGSSPGTSPTPSPSPSPTPSSSPTPTPTPSPSPSGTTLPAGYKWHRFTAAEMGTVAGFKIAVPDAWTQAIDVLVVHLNRAARNFHILVNLADWVYVKPLPQAQYLQTQAAHSHNHYKLLVLEAIGFKSVGYTSAAAAELKFSWVVKSTGVSYTEMVILVTLSTKAGAQPYTFTLTAPTATFPAADSIFHVALKSFRPLPA